MVDTPLQAPVLAIELGTFALVAWLCLSAYRQGHRWLGTLLWGAVFGYFVEYCNVHGTSPIYEYPQGSGFALGGVPLWVPIGWGGILYASTWTAQRLGLSWALRPITAAFLAASVDLSLDPVAHALKFWIWNPYRVSFFGVPFDNYLGWYLIVSVYALFSRALLGLVSRWLPAARAPWSDFLFSGAAAAAAFGAFTGLKALVSENATYHGNVDGSVAAKIFAGVGGLAATVTIWHAIRGRRDHPVNWAVVLLPAIFHALCFGLWLSFGSWTDEPALLVVIPTNFVLGSLLFAWPSLETLLSARASPARSRDR